MITDPFAKILAAFMEQRSIPASKLKSKKILKRLQTLIDTGVIVLERSGGGQKYSVKNSEGLNNFIKTEFPSGLKQISSLSHLPRSQAVGFQKNAHGAKSNCLPLFLKGFNGAQLISGDKILPVADLTDLAGGAGLCLEEECLWSFNGTIVTVENPEVFFHVETIIPNIDLAIYTGGRLSNLLLKWLSSNNMKNSSYIHSGDYDPVGLQDYLRLKDVCPGRVSLYVPDDLESLFADYANKQRIEDQVSILKTIRNSRDPYTLKVVDLIYKYNGGVDQEALLMQE